MMHYEEYHTCIKCGLDTHAIDMIHYYEDAASPLDYVMYSVLEQTHFLLEKTKTDIVCSLDLAKGIYQGIKHAHPDLSDEKAALYLKQALYNIRGKKKRM